jgi:hypothetical protein
MEEELIIAIFFFVTFLGMVAYVIYANYHEGYKKGQIDALSGNVKYELKENEQGETTWQEIKDKDVHRTD